MDPLQHVYDALSFARWNADADRDQVIDLDARRQQAFDDADEIIEVPDAD